MAEEPSTTPATAQDHLNQAFRYEEKDDPENALRECEAALELDPDLAGAHNLRGVVLEELGRPEEAILAYRRALQLKPDFDLAKQNLAEIEADMPGLKRSRRARMLEQFSTALRVVAWTYLAFQIIRGGVIIYSIVLQRAQYDALSLALTIVLNLVQDVVVIGAAVFVALLALAAICERLAGRGKPEG